MKPSVFTPPFCLFFCICGFFLASLALSCTSARANKSSLHPVYVTNSKKVYVLPPKEMEGALEKEAVFTGTFGTEQFSALSYIYADTEEISLLLFNDFGVSMGTISYDGSSATLDSAYFGSALKAEYVILDFQNACYNGAALKAHYQKSGLIFETARKAHGERRTVRNKDTIIEDIFISSAKISIHNYLRNYTYELTFVED